ncbi:MAG: hypothetical protein GY940_47085 [bacterium]|nr:hypothetical protein [bacterium]
MTQKFQITGLPAAAGSRSDAADPANPKKREAVPFPSLEQTTPPALQLAYFNPVRTPPPGDPGPVSSKVEKKAFQDNNLTDNTPAEPITAAHGSTGKARALDIDIHRLTDRVYHMLESKIRMEKERRGW